MKIVEIQGKLKKETELFFRNEWKKSDKSKGFKWDAFGGFLEVKDEKGNYAGLARFEIIGGAAELKQLIVIKEARKKGIGKMLIKKFEEIARKKKCHVVYLKTSERHKTALKFYKNHGYKIVTKLPNNKFHLTWYFLEKKLK